MNWSPEQETVTVQTTHFGLLMSVRCENINRLLIILKYQLMKYLYYTKKHAFEVLFIEVRSYALHRRNCWSVLQSKTRLKLGLTWDVTNFLVWHTQPWGNNSITVSLQSLKFQDPSFDSSSCSTRAYPAEFYSGPSWVQILPARLPRHRNFCKNVSEVPAFLISWINHQTVVPHCGSTIACNSKQIFESEIRSGGGG